MFEMLGFLIDAQQQKNRLGLDYVPTTCLFLHSFPIWLTNISKLRFLSISKLKCEIKLIMQEAICVLNSGIKNAGMLSWC